MRETEKKCVKREKKKKEEKHTVSLHMCTFVACLCRCV